MYKQKGGNDLLQGLLPSDMFSPNEIDITIAWAGEENYMDKDIESNEMESKDRMRNNNELKYCLRSIHKYAPWIRHVYILVNTPATWPTWLDQSKAKKWISVIDRCKYFEDKNLCPTYNINPVLANIHKIPEISNWFVNLEDDMFFGNTVNPEDFFTKEGKPYYYQKSPSWGKWAGHGPHEVYEESKLKDAKVIPPTPRPLTLSPSPHVPIPLRKDFIANLYKKYKKFFDFVISHKHRWCCCDDKIKNNCQDECVESIFIAQLMVNNVGEYKEPSQFKRIECIYGRNGCDKNYLDEIIKIKPKKYFFSD